MKGWIVWKDGDQWRMIWPFMDAATKTYLAARGYHVMKIENPEA